MKTLKILKTDTYANPNPALPHTKVVEGTVVELDDRLANSIIGHGGAEVTERAVSDDDLSPAEVMAEANKKKDLQAACKANDLDTGGNKTELSQRLLDAGITEL